MPQRRAVKRNRLVEDIRSVFFPGAQSVCISLLSAMHMLSGILPESIWHAGVSLRVEYRDNVASIAILHYQTTILTGILQRCKKSKDMASSPQFV